jgi:hypothetical protein
MLRKGYQKTNGKYVGVDGVDGSKVTRKRNIVWSSETDNLIKDTWQSEAIQHIRKFVFLWIKTAVRIFSGK